MPRKKVELAMNQKQVEAAFSNMASILGVDYRSLLIEFLRCSARKVGWVKMLQCLRQGEDWIGCVLNSIDFDEVLDCALESISGTGVDPSENSSKESDPEEEESEF